MTPSGRRCVTAMFNADKISSVFKWFSIAQPTMRREYTSSTMARNNVPDQVGTYVISATHSRFGASA
jgi:hypothetical protein